MMRIGVLRNTFLPASETFIYEQLNQYRNVQVEVITREVANRDKFPNQWSINTIVGAAGSSLQKKLTKLLYTLTVTSTRHINRIVEQREIELVHAHFGVDAVYAVPVCKERGIPLFATFHGYDITRLPKLMPGPLSWLVYYMKFKRLVRDTTLFLAVSNHIKQKLMAHGVPEQKIKIHYIGIDLAKVFYREAPDRDTITIMTVGRLTEKKGIAYLIEAFHRLAARREHVRLVIAGDGPLRQALTELAASGAGSGRITFLGSIPHHEVLKRLSDSDIFCLPSVTAKDGDQEGLGMVILEASGTGLPVVATSSGGIKDAVQNGKTGYLVEERSAAQLEEKLDMLVTSQPLRAAIGQNGRAFVEQQFDLRLQTEKLEQLYKQYIGEKQHV
ncbi:glycosyltransferase [Paenibacillus sp. Leaf72]|uniref:glycosyltransferase n=1 Tax=Paenibacillus sp. Leaf72 TaxID=1736234 RepID=UPI0009D70DFB|nr:glycosyltransferase [Paenibacillus sp. Leaf72]